MQTNKRALINGITGMDGSHLAELLISKGYEVYGMVLPASTFNRSRIDHIYDTDEKREKYLLYGDLMDIFSILHILQEVQPDEIYNLGAQSHVGISWKVPFYTAQVTGIGVLNLLEAVRFLKLKSKIYQASTSELFSGDPSEAPQDENTRMNPQSPYGTAKLFAHQICQNYREGYDMFICCGILFNHESSKRGDNFVTKKIINAIPKGEVSLGNLDASRDWGYAPEYVEGMWLMLQQDKADDYVLSTNEYHSVREFVEKAFKLKGFDIKWTGSGVDEIGYDSNTNKTLIIISDKYYRPTEVEELLGDCTKAKNILGWSTEYSFDDLIKEMVDYDCNPDK